MTILSRFLTWIKSLRKKRPDYDVEAEWKEMSSRYGNLFRRLAVSEAIDIVKERAGTTTNHAPPLLNEWFLDPSDP